MGGKLSKKRKPTRADMWRERKQEIKKESKTIIEREKKTHLWLGEGKKGGLLYIWKGKTPKIKRVIIDAS